jgi:hypothetical protein
MLPTP